MAVRADSSLCCCCSGDVGTFADAGNLEHCAKYLNQTLVTFGFPASLDLFATDPVSIARTCNCMYALLQQRQRDIEFRESTNDLRQRGGPIFTIGGGFTDEHEQQEENKWEIKRKKHTGQDSPPSTHSAQSQYKRCILDPTKGISSPNPRRWGF
ncbi:unnamed protein product [Triticum turgidum subsp. durum]|uniref:Uncharacterized protein n=1 Tax=Triticum turgidum subsp. durum TaxID=4567 RepID=A0A9R1A2M0_TRITD|nr:unnamed protein product [Triticum turgidum subsp. durum]